MFLDLSDIPKSLKILNGNFSYTNIYVHSHFPRPPLPLRSPVFVRDGLASQTSFVCDTFCEVGVRTCVYVHDQFQFSHRFKCIVKQTDMQLVHVPLSSWHNAAFGTQLGKVCYYSITHPSASPLQGSHVSPALDGFPALHLQVWLTGCDEDGPPTSPS